MPKIAIKNMNKMCQKMKNMQKEICINIQKYARENMPKYAIICNYMQQKICNNMHVCA